MMLMKTDIKNRFLKNSAIARRISFASNLKSSANNKYFSIKTAVLWYLNSTSLLKIISVHCENLLSRIIKVSYNYLDQKANPIDR